MNPLRLRARDFRSYAKLDLEFSDGSFAIVGQNGSGKSTLLLGLDIALFGSPGRSLEPFLRHDSEQLVIDLELEHDGRMYWIKRSFTQGRSTFAFGEGNSHRVALTQETMAESQRALESLLGLTRATFRASSYLAQGDSAVFTNARPGERMEILRETLGGMGVWEVAHGRAKMLRRQADRELERLVVAAELLEADLAARPETVVRYEQETRDLEAAAAELDHGERTLAAAMEAVERVERVILTARAIDAERRAAKRLQWEITQRLTRLRDTKANLERHRQEVSALEQAAVGIEQLERDVDEFAAQVLRHEHDMHVYDSAVAERREMLGRQDELFRRAQELRERGVELRHQARLDEQRGAGNSRCRECDQVLGAEALASSVAFRRVQADELDAAAADVEQQGVEIGPGLPVVPDRPGDPPTTDLEVARVALEECRDADARLVLARARITSLEESLDDEETLLVQWDDAVKEADAKQAEVDALGLSDEAREDGYVERLRDAARPASDEVRRLRADVDALREQRARTEATLRDLDSRAETLAENAAGRERLTREGDVLAVVEEMFGPTGIPLLIIENAIPVIEQRAQEVLEQLGGETASCRIELRTQRSLKVSGALRDTLDIVIHAPNGEAMEYEFWSGGEKMRLDLALRIGLAQLLLTHGANCELFAVDEPDGLDAQGRSALVGIIEEMRARYGFRKVLLISHDDSLRDSFSQTIEVTRSDGGPSTIVSETLEPVPAGRAA